MSDQPKKPRSDKGRKYSEERKAQGYLFQPKQKAWNAGTGGCKRGHDPKLYVQQGPAMVCMGCKSENNAIYRQKSNGFIRFKSRLARYGLSINEFTSMWIGHNGDCRICHQPLDSIDWVIDHCHATEAVRGLLCRSCNTALGLFQDSIGNLESAIQYLLPPPEINVVYHRAQTFSLEERLSSDELVYLRDYFPAILETATNICSAVSIPTA